MFGTWMWIGETSLLVYYVVALESFVLHMPAALILHCELLQGGSAPFVPICLEFVAPSWS